MAHIYIYLLVVCWPSSWCLYKGSWGRKNFMAFPANEWRVVAHLQRCLGTIFVYRLFCWKDSKNITSHGISDGHRIRDFRAGVGAGNVWRLKKVGATRRHPLNQQVIQRIPSGKDQNNAKVSEHATKCLLPWVLAVGCWFIISWYLNRSYPKFTVPDMYVYLMEESC